MNQREKMKSIKTKVLLFFICIFIHIQAEKADLIIYSYDRPIQLYALLESLEVYTENLDTVQVIYLVTNQDYEDAYQKVWKDFLHVKRFKQGSQPRKDFKPLTMQALLNCSNEYVLFAVDDIIVKDYIDFDDCINQLKKYNAYGFYLRLGKHLDYCYAMSRKQPLPSFVFDDGNVCAWKFRAGSCDWGYPNTVDMTLYSKKRVISHFHSLQFTTPNRLEGAWSSLAGSVQSQIGLCYAETKIVNLPLNLVQKDWSNRHMDFLSAEELLTVFNQGKKIDIYPLYKIKNNAAHMDYEPTFMSRECPLQYGEIQ